MITSRLRLFFLLLTILTTRQLDAQTDCDYLNQSFNILEQAIYDELVTGEQKWDSAHVLFDGDILMCVTKDSSDFRLLSSEYNVVKRNNSRVVSVSTECVTATYAYNLFGRLKSIRFKYSVGLPLFEGTWSKMVFAEESDNLVYVGEDIPENPIFTITYFN